MLGKGLIVSCQPKDEVDASIFYDYDFIERMALAAQLGGAMAVKIEGINNIKKLKKILQIIPIIGLVKRGGKITCDIKTSRLLHKAGADVIAVNGTDMKQLQYFMETIDFQSKIWADVSNIEEALHAESLGVDYIASTYALNNSSYPYSRPNIDILYEFNKQLEKPFFAAGGFGIAHIQDAMALSRCQGIVVGTEITRPHIITKKYLDRILDFFIP